jgi:hypothetical protein
MNQNKAPTAASTTPLGNTRDVYPTPLSRDINPFIRTKLKDFPDQRRRINEVLRKKATQSGHADR